MSLPARTKTGFGLAVAVLAAVAGVTPAARAEDGAPLARALFDTGRLLVRQGRYSEACPRFAESLRLAAGLGTEFNLADCLEHLDEKERARELFLDVAEKSRADGQLERAELATARAAALAPAAAVEPEVAPPRSIQKLPELVIQAPAKPPKDSSDAATLPVLLRNESGALAEAEVTLQGLRQAAARLRRERPNDPRLRALEQKLSALQNGLADSWRLAGAVASAAIRRAEWEARRAKQAAGKRGGAAAGSLIASALVAPTPSAPAPAKAPPAVASAGDAEQEH